MLVSSSLKVIKTSKSKFKFHYSTCCNVTKPKERTLADERPDLNFDYLLDENNIKEIETNISNRKGIGNIKKIHETYKNIQQFNVDNTTNLETQREQFKQLWTNLYKESLLIPNKTSSDVPIGDPSNSQKIAEKSFKFSEDVKYRIAENIGKSFKSVIYPRRAAGGRSYAFIGAFANLETALFKYARDIVLNKGFKEVEIHDILPKIITESCGLNIREDDENVHTLQYTLADYPKMCLSGTAEMGIAQLLEQRIFEEQELPLFLVAESRCFRPEISTSAVEAKLYRVHEFNKLEMFAVCRPDQSFTVLDEFVKIQRKIWDGLGIGYKVLNMSSEELGAAASKKYDIEAFMPGRNLYGEVSSASNCTDYQSRRLGIRYKDSNGNLTYAHTCNGTAIASSRALITIIESFQSKTGFKPPSVLKPYLPKSRTNKLIISPA